jgi:hypothetical protein
MNCWLVVALPTRATGTLFCTTTVSVGEVRRSCVDIRESRISVKPRRVWRFAPCPAAVFTKIASPTSARWMSKELTTPSQGASPISLGRQPAVETSHRKVSPENRSRKFQFRCPLFTKSASSASLGPFSTSRASRRKVHALRTAGLPPQHVPVQP